MNVKWKYQVNYIDSHTLKCSTRYFMTLKGILNFVKRKEIYDFIVIDINNLSTINIYDFMEDFL